MDRGRITKEEYFIGSILIGFLLGVASASYVTIPIQICIGIVVFGICFLCIRYVAVALLLVSFVLGVSRFTMSVPKAHLEVGKKQVFSGPIDTISRKDTLWQFVLRQDTFGILVSTRDDVVLTHGDIVSVRGTPEVPENFITDQGTTFDYVSYLYVDAVTHRMSFAKVLAVQEKNYWYEFLFNIKETLMRELRSLLPRQEAELANGILLGARQSLPASFRNDLITTGTIHIIALSGYNVAIVAEMIGVLFRRLGKKVSFILGSLSIVAFVLMTGLQSSAVRAAVMAIIALVARVSGRTYDAFRGLVGACVLMVLWNPRLLVFDVSFHLSVLATLGLLFIAPHTERWCKKIPRKIFFVLPFRESVSLTTAAQIAVLPYILSVMGTFSLTSIPANVAVLPVIPLAMASSAGAGLVSFVSPLLAYPFSVIATGLLSYVSWVITLFAKIKWSLIIIPIPAGLAVVLYMLLIIWLCSLHTKYAMVSS